MVLSTPLASMYRKFEGKRFSLEEASRTKPVVTKRKKQLLKAGYKVRTMTKAAGYHLLYCRR